MDPPRSKPTKGKKKKLAKKKAYNDGQYSSRHDEFDTRRHPRSPNIYDSEANSSFDEVNHSDAECCPTINSQEEDSEDDDAIVKRLYKGPRKCGCCVNWVKHPPQGVVESNTKDKTSKHAFTARYSSKKKDMQVTTTIHSIAVHSQHLKDVLTKVLDKYPGVNIGRGDASFYPPFQPLVHVWKDLQCSISDLEGEAREHGDAFLEIVEPEIGETIKDRDDLLSRGLITFEVLWTLYKPGARIFCEVEAKRHLMEITGIVDEPNSFVVNLKFWDLSPKLPYAKSWSELEYVFSGTKRIEELGAIPYDSYPSAENVEKELRQRGQKIREIPQGGLKWFKGFVTVPLQAHGSTRRRWIEGRIIVDPAEYDKMNTNWSFEVPPDPMLSHLPVSGTVGTSDGDSEANQDQLAQSRSVVRGFSLATKSWHEFEVDDISDIEWNDQAFDQLVMQSSRKRLIKALVDSNQGRNTGFDDFIKGKGQGLIMLLSGRPGTGKTLTAESIAERIHLPLYSVHSSELSAANATSGDIETKLSDILHRAAHWNAVLLIDEADAFLETRNAWDMERNQRVAVFLRLLEFYSGVLILTTNRRISFDPAFYSRIHLTLKFEDLDHGARSSIWKNFLRSMPNNVHENDVSNLAEAKLNGRQIKNVIKMSSLLAHSEGETLCTEHLETMLEAVDEIGDEEHSGSDDEKSLIRDD